MKRLRRLPPAARRAAQRARWQRRVCSGPETPNWRPERAWSGGIIAIVVTLLFHGGLGLLAERSSRRVPSPREMKTVTVKVVAPPKKVEAVAEAQPTPPATPIPPAPKRPRPSKKKRVQARPQPRQTPAPEPPPTPAKKRRRVVGLRLEGTSQNANAPTFGVGNSAFGRQAPQQAPVEKDDPGPTERTAAGFGGGQGTTPPVRLSAPEPRYPPGLKARGIEADVVLNIELDAAGNVTSVRVARSSGYAAFDNAATDAARATRYRPAVRGGQAVAYPLSYTVRFRIKDG